MSHELRALEDGGTEMLWVHVGRGVEVGIGVPGRGAVDIMELWVS